MISISHNTQPWHLRLLAMTNKSFLGCWVLGTLSIQPEGEVLETLPCFWDLVCGLNTFLTAGQLQPHHVQELSRGASHRLGLNPALGHSHSLGKSKAGLGGLHIPRVPNVGLAWAFPLAEGSYFVCSTGTLLLHVMFQGFLTGIKLSFLCSCCTWNVLGHLNIRL